jgi:diazepam-binding inhibitor (GABA receptor modulator, acyl-CoA-binding protein)
MEQKEIFEQAVSDSKQLPVRPDNETLLRIYSLYKQATEGDNPETNKPVMFDFVAQAKYDAWLKLKGMVTADAMQQYVDLITDLKK